MIKNNLVAIGNINSNITQVNIEGLTKEEVQELCLKLVDELMARLRADAAEVFKSQVYEFVELFFQRLAEIAGSHDVLNKLKTPAVQFALDEALLIYGKHPTLEEKEMQVELLIDKIKTNDNSTKGIIIDAARLELCNLTNAQISLLAFIIICGLIIECKEKKELFDYFHGHSGLLSDIQSMEKVDFAYLQHTNSLHRISFVKNADFLEKNLFDKYAERTGSSTEEKFKSYLNTTSPLWSSVLDKIKSNNMACYEPTAVGFYIGLKRLEKTFGWNLDFEALYVGA